MKIECRQKPGRKEFLTIFCDDEPWRDIHTSIFGRQPTFPQQCPSLEELTQLFTTLEYRGAKQYVLRRITAQSLPTATLARALSQRLVSDHTSQRILDEVVALGYVNDGEWTQSFVRSQSKRKYGPRAIAAKLVQKGMDREEVQEAINALDDTAQREGIAELLRTRYRNKDLNDYREKQKVVAALIRRGFDLSLVLESLAPTAAE